MRNAGNLIVAVDFDGTIVEHCFPVVGREVAGACEWMRQWIKEGALLILLTMRSDRVLENGSMAFYLRDALDFCSERGVTFWGVNHNPEQKSWTTSPKVYAHNYVDDAGIGAPLLYGDYGGVIDWSKVGPEVLRNIEARKKLFQCPG